MENDQLKLFTEPKCEGCKKTVLETSWGQKPGSSILYKLCKQCRSKSNATFKDEKEAVKKAVQPHRVKNKPP